VWYDYDSDNELLYVHITSLPNNISLYALLNMSENGTLSPNYRTGDMKGFYVEDMKWRSEAHC